jgi:hypothetical protein
MRHQLPSGWVEVPGNAYCIRSECGQWTVCKIGGADGWRYELWNLKEAVAVGMNSAAEAIRECESRRMSSSSAPAAGAKSSPSPAGDRYLAECDSESSLIATG